MKRKSVLAAVVLLLVAAAVLVPVLLLRAQDNALLAEPVSSPVSSQGASLSLQDFPLAQSLYLQRREKGKTGMDAYTDGALADETSAPGLFAELRQAGLAPEGRDATAYVDPETGLAVSIGWSPEEDDPPMASEELDQFIRYLGLDALTDWQEVPLSEGGANRFSGRYSPTAQLYLMQTEGKGYLMRGLVVYSLPPEQLEDMAPAGGGGGLTPQAVPGFEATSGAEAHPFGNRWERLREGNTQRYYTLETIPNTWWTQVLSIDYETAIQQPLCTLANCEHKDESCPSWVPYGDVQYLYAGKDFLLWLFDRYDETDGNISPAHIDISGLDGSNRRRLASYGEDDFLYSEIYTDGHYLAYIRVHKEPRYKNIAHHLTLLSLDTGEVYRETPLEAGRAHHIQGVVDGELVLTSRTMTITPEGEVDWDDVDYLLYTLPLNGGPGRELDRWKPENYPTYIIYEGALYHKKDDGTLVTLDIHGRVGETVFQKPPEWIDYSVELRDGHLFLSAYLESPEAGGVPIPFTQSLAGGNLAESTLTRSFKGERSPLLIVAETPDDFLVHFDTRTRPLTLLGTDGSPYTIQQDVYVYGLISKDDYYANNPNYREVTVTP